MAKSTFDVVAQVLDIFSCSLFAIFLLLMLFYHGKIKSFKDSYSLLQCLAIS